MAIATASAPRAAFTLPELVISLSLSTVIVLSLHTSMYVALTSIPSKDSPIQMELEASSAIRRMLTEMETAVRFLTVQNDRITFLVPDRDDDGTTEVIEFAWPAAGHGDVTRRFNGQQTTLLRDVKMFSLKLESEDVPYTVLGPPTEHSEKLADNVGSGAATAISTTQSIGQILRPSTSGGGQLWKPKKVRLRIRRSNSGSSVDLKLKPALVNISPSSDRLVSGKVTLSAHQMPSNFSTWVDFDVPDAPWADSRASFCVELAKSSLLASDSSVEYLGGSGLMYSSLGVWQHLTTNAVEYELHGTRGTAGNARDIKLKYFEGATAHCKAADTQGSTRTSCSLLNSLPDLANDWRLTFDVSPLDVDDDRDGVKDWRSYSGGLLTLASISNGVWDCNGKVVETTTESDFDNDAIVDLDWRCVSTLGEGIVGINAFRSNAKCCPIRLVLRLEADGSHYLTIENPYTTPAPQIYIATGLPSDWVRVRLTLDQKKRAITISVNGSEKGTFDLKQESTSESSRTIQIGSSGGSVEFREFRARVWN